MIEKILVLSTAHISVQTNYLLEKAATFKSSELLPFRVVNHEYGFILFLGIEDDKDEFEKVVPEELRKIVRYAIKTGCTFVNFDRDAELNFTFPTFDWDTPELLKDEL